MSEHAKLEHADRWERIARALGIPLAEEPVPDHRLQIIAGRNAGYTLEDRGTWINRPTSDGVSRPWAPLTCAEDAFQLMVDLEIDMEMHPEHVGACVYDAAGKDHMFYEIVPAHQYAERPGAAMRAIVRAAASEHDL